MLKDWGGQSKGCTTGRVRERNGKTCGQGFQGTGLYSEGSGTLLG
jgi:hypothetical protein